MDMQQHYTQREQGWIDLAGTMADDFAKRAAQHDEERSFPHENYAQLRETGYSIMSIPTELGGGGASLLERIKAQERLAQGCGPTALAINLHFNIIGVVTDVWRTTQDARAEALLRKIAENRWIVGGSGSEADNAVTVLRPKATAEQVAGGWKVSGKKIFSTQSIAVDRYFSEATWSTGDDPKEGKIISFLIPRDTQGLLMKDDWNTMGMRATESRSTELQDAFIPDDAIFLERPVFTRGGVLSLFLKAPFSMGAVYLGIAVAARNFVVEFMRDRTRFPLKQPMSHSPNVYNKVGEMDILIESGRAVMWKAGAEIEQDDIRIWSRKSVAARMVAIENAVRVVDLAMRTVGGISYYKRLPLERYFRDVRAGLFHPVDADDTLELLGKTAFGISMSDDDASWG
jgi:alkylation response protein AidB-like acyl-CoA dehydrogenase